MKTTAPLPRDRHRLAVISAALILLGPGLSTAARAQAVTTSSVTFQQGTGGYSGASDRLINMTGGTSSRSTAAVDGSNNGDLTESQYFLTFGSIFGTNAGQIPAGATILDASLTVRTGTSSNDNSSGYFLFSGMRVSYTSGTSLLQFGSGTAAAGPPTSDAIKTRHPLAAARAAASTTRVRITATISAGISVAPT